QNIESLGPIFGAILNMVIGVVSGIVLTAIVALAVRIALRTRSRMLSYMKILLVPGFTAMGFLGARVGLELSGRDLSLYELLAFLLLIGTAAGFAWFALRVVSVIQRRVELRYDEVTTEDRRGRRIKTQMQLIKRVLNTIIIIRFLRFCCLFRRFGLWGPGCWPRPVWYQLLQPWRSKPP